MLAACDEASVAFNATTVCAEFAHGQLGIFAAGNASVVSGEILLEVRANASLQLLNTVAVAGKVVVIQQGNSSFQAALRAEAAGAVGAIVVKNGLGNPFVMPGDFAAVAIPIVLVPNSIEAALNASEGLRVTIAAARKSEFAVPFPHAYTCKHTTTSSRPGTAKHAITRLHTHHTAHGTERKYGHMHTAHGTQFLPHSLTNPRTHKQTQSRKYTQPHARARAHTHTHTQVHTQGDTQTYTHARARAAHTP
jgi:hypothetical protein